MSKLEIRIIVIAAVLAVASAVWLFWPSSPAPVPSVVPTPVVAPVVEPKKAVEPKKEEKKADEHKKHEKKKSEEK